MTVWDKAFASSAQEFRHRGLGMALICQPLLCVVVGIFVFKPDNARSVWRVLLTALATLLVAVANIPIALLVGRWLIRL